MKTTYFAVFLIILVGFTSQSTLSQSVIPKDKLNYIFQQFETPGISFSDPSREATHKKIEELFHKIRREKKVHPTQIEDAVSTEIKSFVEFVCIIEGEIEDVRKVAHKDTTFTWIWKNVDWNNVSLEVNLKPSGSGYIHLIQKDVGVVGVAPCYSSGHRDISKEGYQPQGTYVFSEKIEKDRNHENHKKTLMKYARCFDSSRGLYTHLGQITANSGGCIRLSEWWSKTIFEKVKKGTKIEVFWRD